MINDTFKMAFVDTKGAATLLDKSPITIRRRIRVSMIDAVKYDRKLWIPLYVVAELRDMKLSTIECTAQELNVPITYLYLHEVSYGLEKQPFIKMVLAIKEEEDL